VWDLLRYPAGTDVPLNGSRYGDGFHSSTPAPPMLCEHSSWLGRTLVNSTRLHSLHLSILGYPTHLKTPLQNTAFVPQEYCLRPT